MSRQADVSYSKSTIVLFVVAASCYISAVAGFGVFHLHILNLDLNITSRCLNTTSRCSDRTTSPGKANDTSCGNNIVAFTACLSHHQLPLPPTPKCTFGREVISVDVYNSVHLWKPEALMSLPFNFSWPGGFTLYVTAGWDCHAQESTDAASFASVTIADHILPSSQWTTFKHLPSLPEHSELTSHSQTSPYTEGVPETRNAGSLVVGRGSLTSRNNSLGIMHKMFHINSSRHINKEVVPLDKDVPESSKKANSIANEHDNGNSQYDNGNSQYDNGNSHTTSSATKILSEKLGISRRTIHQGPGSVVEVITPFSDIEAGSSVDLHHLADPPFVRAQGTYMDVAIRVACTENYYGPRCSKFCRPRDDILGHYRCSPAGQQVCMDGWRGTDCTEAVCSERCLPSRGTCTSPGTCSCRQGWYGEHCERCRTYPGCQHGTCHLPGQCVCHKGWAGPLCDVEALFCLEHKPCQNGGTCLHDAFFNYTCNCPSGYTGTHCEVPLCHNNFCLHGGSCQIAEGTRYCLCPAQFAGPRCQHRLPHHIPTNTSKLSSSCTDASCTPDSHKQMACQEHLCYNKGTCIETDDSQTAQCQCQFPFTGSQCLQVHDPCQSNPCRNGATCKTTDPFTGSFVCNCVSGYFGDVCGDAIADSRRTVCDENVICENGGTCEKWQRSGQFFCKCLEEFTGEFCELKKDNGCSMHTCLNGGTCAINLKHELSCNCDRGYTGLFCQDLADNVCSRVVCQNGGTCLEHNGGFVCACKHKFEGLFCEKWVRRRETTIIVVEAPGIRNERLEVKVQSTFKSTGNNMKSDILCLCSACLAIWILFLALF